MKTTVMGKLIALLLSLLLHGLVAIVMVSRVPCATQPDRPVRLNLASIDLSCTETADDTSKPALSVPPPQAPPPRPTDANDDPMLSSVANSIPIPRPPAPNATALPEPPSPDTTFVAPRAPRQARVVAPARPRRNITPDYPRISRLRSEEGDVTLDIDVNARGTVDDVRIVKTSGFPLLDAAAVKAVRAAQFAPGESDHVPIPSTARLTLKFELK